MKYIKSLRSVIYKLWFLLNPYQRKQSILILCMIIIGSLLETLGVSAILPFIEAILSPGELNEKWYVNILQGVFDIDSGDETVILLGLLIILVYVVKNIYLYVSQIVQNRFKYETQRKLGMTLLKCFVNSSYESYVNTNTAEVIKKIETDIFGAFNVMDNLFHFFSELFTAFLISLFILYTDFLMACCIIGLAAICFAIVVIGLKKQTRKLGEEKMVAGLKRASFAYQTIMGFKEIKVTQTSRYFLEGYNKSYSEQNDAEIKNAYISNLPERLIETICIGALIGLVCIKILMGNDMSTFIPKLSVFAVAAFRLLPSISRMTRYMNGVLFNQVNLDCAYENMKDSEACKEDVEDVLVDEIKDEKKSFEELLLKDIYWKYSGNDKNICEGLNMTIKRGESVGIIGPSGSGKSTVADIILGLLKPQSGQVLLDDMDVFNNPITWSKIIAYVPQNVFLADDTLRRNVAFGQDSIDDEKVWDALEQAQLKEFVKSLPDGLDTEVGERGIKFSGGQRQRVAIARALYNNPQIIVLDEATSALDNETEKAVMEAIEALQGMKTLIIVAHRLTTIRKCDKIYEIKDGKARVVSKERVLSFEALD